MGSKLENLKKKGLESSKILENSERMSNKTVGEVRNMKELADSLPTDVDDEILRASELLREGVKRDASDYMNRDVKATLDDGERRVSDLTDFAADQIQNNRQVSDTYRKMDGVADFGKRDRETGQAQLEKSSADFQATADASTEKLTDAKDDFIQRMDDILNGI